MKENLFNYRGIKIGDRFHLTSRKEGKKTKEVYEVIGITKERDMGHVWGDDILRETLCVSFKAPNGNTEYAGIQVDIPNQFPIIGNIITRYDIKKNLEERVKSD